MAYIIFNKHPGDILEILDYQQRKIILKIKTLCLPLNSMVKMIHVDKFKVIFDAPSSRHQREFLEASLSEMLQKHEISDFSLR